MAEKSTELAVSLAALAFAISVLVKENFNAFGYDFGPVKVIAIVATGVGVVLLALRFLVGQIQDLAAKTKKQ